MSSNSVGEWNRSGKILVHLKMSHLPFAAILINIVIGITFSFHNFFINENGTIQTHFLGGPRTGNFFRDSLIVNVAVAAVGGIDLITSVVFSSLSPIELCARIVLLVSMLLPCLLILVQSHENLMIVLPMLSAREILRTCSILLVFSKTGKNNALNLFSWIALTCFTIATLLRLHSYDVPSDHDTSIVLPYILLYSISIFGIMRLCMMHLNHFHRVYENKPFSFDYLICIIFTFWLGSLLIGLILYAIQMGPNINNINYLHLTILTYLELLLAISVVTSFSYKSAKMIATLKAALALKRDFVRLIAHESRIPLNTIVIGLDLLKAESIKLSLPPHIMEIVKDIQGSGDMAVGMINEFLNYDKLDAGILKLELGKAKIWDVVETAIRPFIIQGRQKGIEIEINHQIENINNIQDITVFIDKIKISQVIRNLISNALKFSPQGSKIIVFATIRPATNLTLPDEIYEEYVSSKLSIFRISVKDSGPGITAENQKKLFKQVIQFDPGKLQGGGGSGFGLYMAQSISQLHGGGLSVDSEGLGKGSTFSLDLPVSLSSEIYTGNRFDLGSLKRTSSKSYNSLIQAFGASRKGIQALVMRSPNTSRHNLLQAYGGSIKTFKQIYTNDQGSNFMDFIPKKKLSLVPDHEDELSSRESKDSQRIKIQESKSDTSNHELSTKSKRGSRKISVVKEQMNAAVAMALLRSPADSFASLASVASVHEYQTDDKLDQDQSTVLEFKDNMESHSNRIVVKKAQSSRFNSNEMDNTNVVSNFLDDNSMSARSSRYFNDGDFDLLKTPLTARGLVGLLTPTMSQTPVPVGTPPLFRQLSKKVREDMGPVMLNTSLKEISRSKRRSSVFDGHAITSSLRLKQEEDDDNQLAKRGSTGRIGEDLRKVHIHDESPSPLQNIGDSNILRILIVDDSQINRRMLVRLLEQYCNFIADAEDGVSAITKCVEQIELNQPFHLIFIDNHMPNMDGPTSVKIIRALDKNVVIVGLSGDAEQEAFILQGANDVLLKPVRANTVKKIVSETVAEFRAKMSQPTVFSSTI